jgi:glycerol-3-phosphate dehydrogenase
MAKMTVDRIVERDARDAPCRTHEIPLGQAIAVEELPRVEGVPEDSYAALAGRYGHAAHDVLALAAECGTQDGTSAQDGRGELAQPIVPGLPDLLAEAALAARREQARSIGDVMLRRTRLGLLAARELTADATPGESGPVQRVGNVLARELGWDAERLGREIERFAAEAAAEGIAAGGERGAARTGQLEAPPPMP